MKKAKIGFVLVCLVLSSAIVLAAVPNDILKVTVKDKNSTPGLYLDPSKENVNISLEEAKNIAESEANYFPPSAEELAGEYIVYYSRVIKGILCLSDGITIRVNPNTGDIMSYYKTWTIPEEKIDVSPVPTVAKKDAETILQNYMSKELSTKVNLLSTKQVWMDTNYPVPQNGSNDIRLAWWIEFDDSRIRSMELPCPAAAWIDAHSGEVLRLVYDVG